MNDEALEQLIADTVGLIAVDAKGLAEGRARSGKFLVACAILTSALKVVETEMAKTETAQDATEAQVISELPGTKITEKKSQAKMNPEVISTKHKHAEMEAKRNWLKNYIKIFENAHLMYRQYSREG